MQIRLIIHQRVDKILLQYLLLELTNTFLTGVRLFDELSHNKGINDPSVHRIRGTKWSGDQTLTYLADTDVQSMDMASELSKRLLLLSAKSRSLG